MNQEPVFNIAITIRHAAGFREALLELFDFELNSGMSSSGKRITVQAEADSAVSDAQAERDETVQEVPGWRVRWQVLVINC